MNGSSLKFFLTLCFSLVFSFPAFAQTTSSAENNNKSITLKDGSVIQGRLVQYQNGEYVIESPNLGQMHLKEADVSSIVTGGSHSARHDSYADNSLAQPKLDLNQQMSAMKEQLMSDPAMSQQIQNLTENPEIMAIIQDPAFMSQLMGAMSSGNPNTALNNPKMQQLLNNPQMQQILHNAEEKIQPQQKLSP